MKEDPTSLDRLHDIVVPPPVSWWPPAPGWYALSAVAISLLGYVLFRQWRRWKANAYRREALRELESARTAAEISEILRRTALAVAPREMVAALTGAEWTSWLTAQAPEPMPQQVGEQLAGGFYRSSEGASDLTAMRSYAAGWIHRHRAPVGTGAEN